MSQSKAPRRRRRDLPAFPASRRVLQLLGMHVEFGQRLADQATGPLFYALNVRKP